MSVARIARRLHALRPVFPPAAMSAACGLAVYRQAACGGRIVAISAKNRKVDYLVNRLSFLEAVLPDFLGDHLFDPLDIVDLLALQIAPHGDPLAGRFGWYAVDQHTPAQRRTTLDRARWSPGSKSRVDRNRKRCARR